MQAPALTLLLWVGRPCVGWRHPLRTRTPVPLLGEGVPQLRIPRASQSHPHLHWGGRGGIPFCTSALLTSLYVAASAILGCYSSDQLARTGSSG